MKISHQALPENAAAHAMSLPHPSPVSPSSAPNSRATPAAPALPGAYHWCLDELHGIAAHFAQIYFIPSAGIGLLLLALLALADLPAALSGLGASVAAACFAIALRLPSNLRRAGLFGYNGALTGIAFGAIWQPDMLFLVWLAVCAGLTVVATAGLARYKLPALTGPFVAVMALSWTLQPWLALTPRTGLPACDATTPGFVFCSVGQVVFVTPLVLGLLTWYVLALWNARATLWALAASIAIWLSLAVVATHLPSMTAEAGGMIAEAGGIGVNAFLAALGLSVFGRRPVLCFAGAALAAAFCVVLGNWLGPLGWPYFTLPFNLAVWTILGATARRRKAALRTRR